MVIDSVEAILSKADIDGWEDESILRGYLKKLGVKKEIYNKFLSKTEYFDFWINDNYFSQHYNEFVSSTEYAKKSKQKTFQKLSDSEQKNGLIRNFTNMLFRWSKKNYSIIH